MSNNAALIRTYQYSWQIVRSIQLIEKKQFSWRKTLLAEPSWATLEGSFVGLTLLTNVRHVLMPKLVPRVLSYSSPGGTGTETGLF